MDIYDHMLHNVPLENPEDMDVLLEFAELVRDAIGDRRYADISGLIRFSIEHSYYEAFYWVMGILDEVCGQADDPLAGFECAIGKTIPDYEEFILRLGVDLNAFENDVLQVRDENGEVQSFFNIIRYKTGFAHIDLVSSENFDARDNDYIEYMLVCHC